VALLATLDDAPTRRAVEAERTVLHALGGGCSVPVGALAACAGAGLALTAGVFAPDGTRAILGAAHGTDPAAVGTAVARRLLELGAAEVLAASDRSARLDRPAPAEVRP
jgi:hydroxymethylbilane synthase